MTKLILSSLNVWMLEQPSLVSGRMRGALPVVRDRNALVTTLKGLLEALGLERRAKKVATLEDVAAEYAEKAASVASGEVEASQGHPEPPTPSDAIASGPIPAKNGTPEAAADVDPPDL